MEGRPCTRILQLAATSTSTRKFWLLIIFTLVFVIKFSLKYFYTLILNAFYFSYHQRIVLYVDSVDGKWEQMKCSSKLSFICEYGEEEPGILRFYCLE